MASRRIRNGITRYIAARRRAGQWIYLGTFYTRNEAEEAERTFIEYHPRGNRWDRGCR